jgi:hypothetical protein
VSRKPSLAGRCHDVTFAGLPRARSVIARAVFRGASHPPVRRFSAVAFDAVETDPEPAAAAFGGDDPWKARPRRIVADVLVVPALQLGDPVPLAVLVEARDPTFHHDPRDMRSPLLCIKWAAPAGINDPTPPDG